MTCIVGVAREGTVWMGGDSRVSCWASQGTMQAPKIFAVGEMLVGFSGDVRAYNILSGALSLPTRTEGRTDMQYLSLDVMAEIRRVLGEHGHLETVHGRQAGDAYLLLGYRGKVYEAYGDFSVIEPAEQETATGSGCYHAMGALYATRALADAEVLPEGMDPVRRIVLALDAASEYAVGVAPPYTVMRLTEGKIETVALPDDEEAPPTRRKRGTTKGRATRSRTR